MKDSIFIVLLSLAFFGVFVSHTNASLVKKSFGGRVISTTIPSVTCIGQGPLIISKISSGLPLAIPAQNTKGKVNSFSQIIGKYSLIPDTSICQQQTPAGPVPFPVYKIDRNYGSN